MNSGAKALVLCGLALGVAGCLKCASPCEPWKRQGLDELAVAPGQFITHCDATRFRWRVVPGGTAAAWYAQLARNDYPGWKLYRGRTLIRAGEPAVAVSAREDGNDLIVELTVDPTLDVARALAELSGTPDAGAPGQ